MSSWFQRRRGRHEDVQAALPSAWRYGGPTSDQTRQSSTVTPVSSLTAAARRTQPGDDQRRPGESQRNGGDMGSWDAEAWAMYDQVGELRYTANAISGRMGQGVLYVEKDGERIEDSEDNDEILAMITGQMVERLGLNLFVAGGAWLCGLPKEGQTTSNEANADWIVASSIEVKRANGKATIRGKEYVEAEIYMEKIWDPHPAIWEQADSPVRSALPVLRELVGLTQHVSAQIDSRLAGAGVYWIPNEILANPKVPDETGAPQFSQNAVLNAIMTGMLLPMEDRSNASAVVPLLMGAPGDHIKNIRFDSFATPFDENTQGLREEAIRRLALCLDAPPELLLGMGDSNHWASWLVRDEVVTVHVDPRLALIADALTTGFYRPIKRQTDPGEDVSRYVLRFDTSGLVQRPNRLADASQLHGVDAIGDKALRMAGGFEESDAPTSRDRAIKLAIQVASSNPQLLDNMPEIVDAVLALLDGSPETGPAAVQSQRVEGTLNPVVPANADTPKAVSATSKVAPIAEVDGPPGGGGADSPLAADKRARFAAALQRLSGPVS